MKSTNFKVDLLGITANTLPAYSSDNIEKVLEIAGKGCYGDKSLNSVGEGTEVTFLKKLLKSGHHSVFEHASATFKIYNVSRNMTHQLVRHRLASFSQESLRYVTLDDFSNRFVIPKSIDSSSPLLRASTKDIVEKHFNNAVLLYKRLIEEKVPAEDARYVLPTAIASDIVITANLREWIHIVNLRFHDTTGKAQWEIKNVVGEIRNILSEQSPTLFPKEENE